MLPSFFHACRQVQLVLASICYHSDVDSTVHFLATEFVYGENNTDGCDIFAQWQTLVVHCCLLTQYPHSRRAHIPDGKGVEIKRGRTQP